MKKDLQEWGEQSVELAKRTSEINRQLVFAGIAIIWIFKNPDNSPAIIKDGLILPLFLYILSLSVDLFQHFFGAMSWYVFYHIKLYKSQNGKLSDDEDVTGPSWIDFTSTSLFVVKIVLNIIGYLELGKFILPKLPIK